MPHWWKITAGENGVRYQDFMRLGIVAMYWEGIDDCRRMTPGELLDLANRLWPDMVPKGRATLVQQYRRFVDGVHRGDVVVTYDPSEGVLRAGEIISVYQYSKDCFGPWYSHFYSVEWRDRAIKKTLPWHCQSGLNAAQPIYSLRRIDDDLGPFFPTMPRPG